MWVAMGEMWRLEAPGLGMVVALGGIGCLLWRARLRAAEREREKRFREELEAYGQLEMRLPADGNLSELARRVCRMVAEKSAFYRVAMLVRGEEGQLYVSGSVGMESETVRALDAWGRHVLDEERRGRASARRGDGGLGMRVGNGSFAIVLGKDESEETGLERAIVIPMWTSAGRVVGALAVGADRMLSVRRRVVEAALLSLEALAAKLGRRLENAALAERLLRAERLASLGLLAGGVAHALNNPLTAVLGFAELIVDTADEVRVKTDAGMIVREALRMRETVDVLRGLWQPAAWIEESVRVAELVREMAEECRKTLEDRGVRLVVQIEPDLPLVRGSRGRLRQMLEHLLNNAAEAVALSGERGGKEAHAVRIAVSQDERYVHLIVSDTGPGFKEPGRVFDPFYTTRLPQEGAGLGLSVCYGIVREHGGEISAFNLQPCGAAVAIELPVGEVVVEESVEAGAALVSDW